MENLRINTPSSTDTETTFRMLYDESYCQIYNIAFGMLRNEHDAWDVLQNVYIKTLLKSDTLRDSTKIKSWMLQITYNECKNMLKSKKRSLFRFYHEADVSELDEYTSVRCEEMTPMDFSEISEVRDELTGLMEQLPELQRQVIMMYYYEQNSIEEIARKLDCSTGTVKSRLNYAKKKLRTLVCEYETVNNVSLRCGFLFTFVQGLLGAKQVVLTVTTAVAATAACCTGVVMLDRSVAEEEIPVQPAAEVIEYTETTLAETTAEEIARIVAAAPTVKETDAETVQETTVETLPETLPPETAPPETAPPVTAPVETAPPELPEETAAPETGFPDWGGYYGQNFYGWYPPTMHPGCFWPGYYWPYYGYNGYDWGANPDAGKDASKDASGDNNNNNDNNNSNDNHHNDYYNNDNQNTYWQSQPAYDSQAEVSE